MRTKAGEVTRTGSGRPGRERRRGTRQASLPRFCILAALENQPETAHVLLTFTESFFLCWTWWWGGGGEFSGWQETVFLKLSNRDSDVQDQDPSRGTAAACPCPQSAVRLARTGDVSLTPFLLCAHYRPSAKAEGIRSGFYPVLLNPRARSPATAPRSPRCPLPGTVSPLHPRISLLLFQRYFLREAGRLRCERPCMLHVGCSRPFSVRDSSIQGCRHPRGSWEQPLGDARACGSCGGSLRPRGLTLPATLGKGLAPRDRSSRPLPAPPPGLGVRSAIPSVQRLAGQSLPSARVPGLSGGGGAVRIPSWRLGHGKSPGTRVPAPAPLSTGPSPLAGTCPARPPASATRGSPRLTRSSSSCTRPSSHAGPTGGGGTPGPSPRGRGPAVPRAWPPPLPPAQPPGPSVSARPRPAPRPSAGGRVSASSGSPSSKGGPPSLTSPSRLLQGPATCRGAGPGPRTEARTRAGGSGGTPSS